MKLHSKKHEKLWMGIDNKDWEELDRRLRLNASSEMELLDKICQKAIEQKGKRIRPSLVFHTFKLFNTNLNTSAFLAASLVEILHLASLIHDDVVDQADTRRGQASVPFLFGNKTAVLAGDYIISNALVKAYHEKDVRLILYLVEIIKTMSEGELLQMQYISSPSCTEEVYLSIISKKTASLLGACCRLGAHAAGANEEIRDWTFQMGHHLGMAFQIQDDILDYTKTENIEKKAGNDLKESKITLPVLYYLEKCSSDEKKSFWTFIQQSDKSEDEIENWLHKISIADVLEKCQLKANYYKEQALALLKQHHGEDNIHFTEFIKYV